LPTVGSAGFQVRTGAPEQWEHGDIEHIVLVLDDSFPGTDLPG
jgi:hypothetical protein